MSGKQSQNTSPSKGKKKKTVLRIVMFVLAILLAASAFTYGFTGLFHTEPGWDVIQVNSSSKTNCGDEFTFLYKLGASGSDPRIEQRELTKVYTAASETAYKDFTIYEGFDDCHNLYYINANPNTAIEVDDLLYSALARMAESGNRMIYLGPIYRYYDYVFQSANDVEAQQYDHMSSDELKEDIDQLLAFAMDPDSMQLEVLGNNTVNLHISESCRAFCAEIGEESYLDFYWLKNAFITDFLADQITSAGYFYGVISSHDGYSRCLDNKSNDTYAINLYDYQQKTPVIAGQVSYTGVRSLVCLRGFPIDDSEQYYYTYQDGTIRTRYLDVTDGRCKSSVSSLTAYSTSTCCSDIALRTADIFISDSLDTEKIKQMQDDGIYSIYLLDNTIYTNDPSAEIIPDETYSVQKME